MSLYSNTYRNLYNNNNNNMNNTNNLLNKKDIPSSSQLNSAGRIVSTPINYHYLQKEKEKEKEKERQNEKVNPSNKGLITDTFILNYKPNQNTNINTYKKNENDKNNNDIFYNNIKNNNNNNNVYQQNNFLRRNNFNNNYNYNNNNYMNKNSQDNKEIKLQQNIIAQNQSEIEKGQKAKALMDDFDKKLYDTTTNFGALKRINKVKELEDEKDKELQKERENAANFNANLHASYRKRNFSYDKYNINQYNNNSNNLNIINNNYIPNYHNQQRASLRDTNNLYKNYFSNNINIHPVSQNDMYHKNNFLNPNNNINNIYKNNNYERESFKNKRNSMDKILTNNYYSQNTYRNTPQKGNEYQSQSQYVIKNYSSYSLGGTDGFRRPKTNQDSFLTKQDGKNYIFGVFDGHGLEGHLISQLIKKYLSDNVNSSMFSSRENIFSIFKQLSSVVNTSHSFDAMESGSTAVITFISNETIICANCGDSRAILISDNENNIISLSRDHKPDLPDEKKRIIECGGRVDRICGMGPFRVWFKNGDYPGLAMSRSIGDGYAHKVGVIDEPEIIEYEVEVVKPKAIILASDGVFEFMKNEDIKNIVAKYYYSYDSQTCAKEIVEQSRKIWEDSGYAIDDITCIVGFFTPEN